MGVFRLRFSNYDISDESVSVMTGDIVIGAVAGDVVKAIQMVLVAGKIKYCNFINCTELYSSSLSLYLSLRHGA